MVIANHGAENGVDGRRQIEIERRGGCPILSDCRNGYFLPDSDDERARCVQSMRRRALEIWDTATAIERAGTDGR